MLAVFNDQRLPGKLNTVPTAREQGYDIVWPIIRGFLRGSEGVGQRLRVLGPGLQQGHRHAGIRQAARAAGPVSFSKTGAELDAYVKQQVKQYGELAESFGLIKK